jgi:HAMP domain-containing protein
LSKLRKVSIAELSRTSSVAHSAGNALFLEQWQEMPVGVLAALTRMVEQRSWITSTPDTHHQRIDDKLRSHAGLH